MIAPSLAWIAAGLVACCMELLLPGVYLLWLGLAGIAVGLVLTVEPLGFGMQVAAFIGFAVLAVLAGRATQRVRSAPDPNAGHDLVGQTCRAIAFQGREGRVRFRDSEWAARLQHGTAAPGMALTVTGAEGNTLLVTPEDLEPA